MSEKVPYNSKLTADAQISAEEAIASAVFDDENWVGNETEANEMGKDLLYMVLRRFRKDLFER